jgi:hypothetical protein
VCHRQLPAGIFFFEGAHAETFYQKVTVDAKDLI